MPNPAHLLHAVLPSIRDAVVTVDAAGRVESMNRAAESLTGWTEGDVLGKPVEAILDLRDRDLRDRDLRNTDLRNGDLRSGLVEKAAALPNPAYAALRDAAKVEIAGETTLIAKGGLRKAVELSAAPLHDAEGAVSGAVLILHDLGQHDLSEALQLAHRNFYRSHHDSLTGLPNRILLVDRMEQATKGADRRSGQMAILALDIDEFAQINEAHGHAAGDEFLKEATFRITAALRESDTVCRLGADDFVILLPEITSRADVEALAAKLIQAVAQPFALDEAAIEATCRVGISLYPHDALDADTLMRLADAALTQAKLSGRGRYCFAGMETVGKG
jgi:diguanylate cyclase (GGDEF)-like protein